MNTTVEIETQVSTPIFKVLKKEQSYASVKKHCFVLTPKDGKSLSDLQYEDICTDVVMKAGGSFSAEFKIINGNILIVEFDKCHRLKFDEFEGLWYSAKRIKYTKLMEHVEPYDLIADLQK